MKYLIFFSSIILYSCAAVPITKYATSQVNENSNFTVKADLNSCWDELNQLIFLEKYNIRSQYKSDASGSLRIEMVHVNISYIDEKTNKIADTSAILLGDVRKRINNGFMVYPKAANVECVISLNKTGEDLINVIVSFDRTCTLTEYIENFYLEKRKKFPNVEIKSTGKFEERLRQILSKQ